MVSISRYFDLQSPGKQYKTESYQSHGVPHSSCKEMLQTLSIKLYFRSSQSFFFLKVFTKYITELKGTIVAQKYSEIWTNKTIASSAKFTLKPHFINF